MIAPLEFEPIPAFNALLMGLRGAKLEDPAVEAAVAALADGCRQVRPSDLKAWLPLYRQAIALLPRVVSAHEAIERRRSEAQQVQAARQQLGQLAQAAQAALTRAANDWPPRLQEQLRGPDGLIAKTARSVDKLAVVAVDNASTGQTCFQVEPEQLQGFLGWMATTEARWADNNGKLTAVRAGEALAAEGVVAPPEVPLDVAPVTFDLGKFDPKLQGFPTPTPSPFDLVSTAFKTATATFGSVGMLGYIAPRVFGASAQLTLALSVFFGLVFVSAVVFAAVTVPKKLRQGRELLRQRAAVEVLRELTAAAEKRLERVSDLQLQKIRRHLTDETMRLRALARPGSAPVGLVAAPPMGGLMPRDLEKLRGEWPQALGARLAELEARGL